ncbi:hypothetical protein [Burkholderia gladioli]|uniref:hypothetical protein n=1 Tax=Burkholderia gladioli TaxID=28095 RepID=UPI00301863AA
MNRTTDKLMLIVAAIVLAAIAWALLHYSGNWFFPIASLVVLALLVTQNQKLKRKLKELNGDSSNTKHR